MSAYRPNRPAGLRERNGVALEAPTSQRGVYPAAMIAKIVLAPCCGLGGQVVGRTVRKSSRIGRKRC
jgi:hypothetical protein